MKCRQQKLGLLNLTLILSISFSPATELFAQKKQDTGYLNQTPPGMQAALFAPGIVSTDYVEHSAPAFSPDGTTVLWTVIYKRGTPARLVESKKENSVWTKPKSPSFADSTADDFYPSFSPDGKKLFFSSRRKMPKGYPETRPTLRVWEVERKSTGWGMPLPLDTAVFRTEDYAHTMANNGNLYVSHRSQGGRVFDISIYRKSGNNYLKPELLPYSINTTRLEDAPCIAPDESYLIFESVRPGGMGGSSDLYISFRKVDGSWGTPLNMGDKINTTFAERFVRVSPDGKYIFFGSDRRQGPGIEGSDIYWIDAKVIDELRTLDKGTQGIDNNSGTELLTLQYANNHSETSKRLAAWISTYPNDQDAVIDYSISLRNQQRFLEAETCLKENIKRWPDNGALHSELALNLYGLDKDAEAEQHILKYIRTETYKRFGYITLGTALYGMKKYAGSATQYENALALEPRGADFFNLACAYALANEKTKAFDALYKAVDNGYNAKQAFENDDDLTSLRSDGRWMELIGKMDAQFEGKTPYKRAHHEMVYSEADKSILLLGGSTPLAGGQFFKFFDDIWKYNSSGWSKEGSTGEARSGIKLAFNSKQNKLYSFGGFTPDNQTSGQLRVFENGAWKSLSDLPDMKAAEAGFVYDIARDKFVAFGGSAGRSIVNSSTWEWDGSAWTKFNGAHPQGRNSFVMVYDSKRNKTILFGGAGEGVLDDGVWEFDGKEWKNYKPAVGPGQRIAPGYAYDSKRAMLLIFGGANAAGIQGDTWGWDGKEWKLLAETGPSPRMMGYMAYDKTRDRTVLFGGRPGWPNDAGDTWEWDGKEWKEVK
jgi:tetratricopeptide (TPR) repeat protein